MMGNTTRAAKTAAWIGKTAFTKAGGGVKGGTKGGGEKGNRRVEMNCGRPEDPWVGPTADPADRAHGVMVVVEQKGNASDGRTLLVPAAVKERRGKSGVKAAKFSPAWHATRNLSARPRRYHYSNMRGMLVDVGVELDAREVPRRVVMRVHGPVSLDSVEDDLVERAMSIRRETGTDLLRGRDIAGETPLAKAINANVRIRDLIEPALRKQRRSPKHKRLEEEADRLLAEAEKRADKRRKYQVGRTKGDWEWWPDEIAEEEAADLAERARVKAAYGAAGGGCGSGLAQAGGGERPSGAAKNGVSIEGSTETRAASGGG